MSETSDSAFESELARIEESSPEKARAIEQYRAVAGKFVELWHAIDERTEHSEWREDGVGSCRISPHLFETYVGGPIGSHIEDLWAAVEADNPEPEEEEHLACRFHRIGRGCILGDLKSPRCIDHSDWTHSREISEKIGIVLPDFVEPLVKIEGCGMYFNDGYSLEPEVNRSLVEQTITDTQALIDHVLTFPLLHPLADEG